LATLHIIMFMMLLMMLIRKIRYFHVLACPFYQLITSKTK